MHHAQPHAALRRRPRAPRGSGAALAARLALLGLAAGLFAAPLAAQDSGEAAYSLSADATTGFLLASPSFDPADPGALLRSSLGVELLHRFEGPSWGAVLNHRVDLSTASGAAGLPSPPAAEPAFSGAVHEAYVRLESDSGAQAIFGKRRLPLGLGSAFAPGDLLNPRAGLWDQKTGFQGLSLVYAPSLSYSLRASLSLDRNLAALSGASGAADPGLLTWAGQAEFQRGSLLATLSGVFRPDRVTRPSLGISLDMSGLILQAEGAVELSGGAEVFAAAGARYTLSAEAFDLSLSLDADYGGSGGLLEADWYLLSQLILLAPERFQALLRALVALEEPSALLATSLTLFPAAGLDLELKASLGLGADGSEFAGAALASLGASQALRAALGLAARIHF